MKEVEELKNDEHQAYDHPMSKFAQWYNVCTAATKDLVDTNASWPTFSPQAMQVATCTRDGFPSCRTVLMKHFDENGIVFCTNFDSRKGKELIQNPNVALLFYWTRPITRQIRIEGIATPMSYQEGAKYFEERPVTSRIASIVSKQSQPAESREEIDRLFNEKYDQYKQTGEAVPCPENWGAFLVKPHRIEFWQEGEHRLADRVLYSKSNDQPSQWNSTRLFP